MDWFTEKISPCLRLESDCPVSTSMIERIIFMLNHARDTSKVELRISSTSTSGLIADIAFATAFRRLRKELSFNLTKTLAVCLSFLVDSQKQVTFNANLTRKIDAVTDIIQVNVVTRNYDPFHTLIHSTIYFDRFCTIKLREIFSIFTSFYWPGDF